MISASTADNRNDYERAAPSMAATSGRISTANVIRYIECYFTEISLASQYGKQVGTAPVSVDDEVIGEWIW